MNAAAATISSKTNVLDVLVNNAGISGGFQQSALDTTVDQFKTVYETNVFGVVRVTQAFINLLKKADEPRIVNVTTAMASLTLAADPSAAVMTTSLQHINPANRRLICTLLTWPMSFVIRPLK